MEIIKTDHSKVCRDCNRVTYYKNKNSLLASIRNNQTCKLCQHEQFIARSKARRTKPEFINCAGCSKLTKNDKFCSRRCSANNNIQAQARVKTYCKKCNILLADRWIPKKLCDNCRIPESYTKTLKELRDIYGTFQFHAKIRGLARSNYLKYNKNCKIECKICKYNLHCDICHIKPIKDFTDDSLLSEINHIDNLVALCKNHHWEFDNGHIKLI